jgi:hypothetical protein
MSFDMVETPRFQLSKPVTSHAGEPDLSAPMEDLLEDLLGALVNEILDSEAQTGGKMTALARS